MYAFILNGPFLNMENIKKKNVQILSNTKNFN